MARKELEYTVMAAGRDYGKRFLIREMPSAQAEDWAIRAFMGMAKAGVEIPEGIKEAGLAGMAVIGLQSVFSMPYADAKPLLDEMMACVMLRPDPNNPQVVRALIDEDIEEVETRLLLRKEVFGLHVNFSELAARFQTGSGSATEEESLDTQTSKG